MTQWGVGDPLNSIPDSASRRLAAHRGGRAAKQHWPAFWTGETRILSPFQRLAAHRGGRAAKRQHWPAFWIGETRILSPFKRLAAHQGGKAAKRQHLITLLQRPPAGQQSALQTHLSIGETEGKTYENARWTD